MMNANASAKQIYNAFAIPPTKRRELFSLGGTRTEGVGGPL